MKTKTILFFIFYTVFISAVYCQSDNTQKEYQKIQLSFRAGMDFPLGSSDTQGFHENFTLPLSKGFGTAFDGAYFFSKNYGIGLKYHLFGAKDQYGWEMIQQDKYVKYTFNETTHFICPAFYGQWKLGDSKWEIPASIGIGYVNNKLSNYSEHTHYYFYPYSVPSQVLGCENCEDYVINSISSNSIGAILSIGIRFRMSSLMSIGIYTDGMFSNTTAKTTGELHESVDFSRKINRIGLSAGFEFSF